MYTPPLSPFKRRAPVLGDGTNFYLRCLFRLIPLLAPPFQAVPPHVVDPVRGTGFSTPLGVRCLAVEAPCVPTFFYFAPAFSLHLSLEYAYGLARPHEIVRFPFPSALSFSLLQKLCYNTVCNRLSRIGILCAPFSGCALDPSFFKSFSGFLPTAVGFGCGFFSSLRAMYSIFCAPSYPVVPRISPFFSSPSPAFSREVL